MSTVLSAGVQTAALALAAPWLYLNPKLRGGWRQRLAWGRRPAGAPGRGPHIWAHGASAGDLLALIPTLARLLGMRPDARVTATCLTSTGHDMARAHPQVYGAVRFAPWDAPGPVTRTFAELAPDLLVVEYTELWPQLLATARRAQIPVVLHNGRLRPGKERWYRALFGLCGNLLACFTHLLMRSPADAARALALGAAPGAVRVTGNTKHDAMRRTPPPVTAVLARAGVADDAPVWVAGSTHRGEEPALLDALERLRRQTPRLTLVVVPRYPERADEVVRLARARRLVVAKQSALLGLWGRPLAAAPDVLVVDAVGALAGWYRRAQVAFVGGSLVPRGGQNILEPAQDGVPVAFGPFMHNFADEVAHLAGPGAVRVADGAALVAQLARWLAEPGAARRAGAALRAQVASLGGAAAANAAVLASCLPPAAEGPALRRA